ncbi:MAG: rod shape-determining protein MreC [Candidatus Komeilibacteria bacterium]
MPRQRITLIASSVLVLAALLLGNQLVILPSWRWLYQWEALAKTATPTDQEQTLATLSLQVAALQQSRKENDSLRDLLKFYTQRQYHYQIGYLISRDQFNNNLVTIDLGSANGIRLGQPLVVKQGIIIGKIIRVDEHKAVAELLTSEFSKLPVTTASLRETSGLLVGSLGNTLRLQFIPTQTGLKERELIVTSGLENEIPAGLVVGTVERIESPASEVYKQADIKPIIDYQQTTIISVITE